MEPRKQSFEPNGSNRSDTAITDGAKGAWWDNQHASGWERVRDAFRRDWEQTKAGFSKSSGHHLNQNAADTVKQALGTESIPSLAEKTRPTDRDEAAKPPKKASHQSQKSATAFAAHTKLDDAHTKDDVDEGWEQAEREARYGFAARAHYPQYDHWGEPLETTLRGEWVQLKSGRSWSDSRDGVRRGWEFSKPKSH